MRVELQSEGRFGNPPYGKIKIFDDNSRLVAAVRAFVKLKQGLDGGWYHCVELEKEQIHPLTGKVI